MSRSQHFPKLLHLREWREHQYLSRHDLARLAGCGEQTIKFLETQRSGASALTLVRLAQALGVTPQMLIAQTPPTLQMHQQSADLPIDIVVAFRTLEDHLFARVMQRVRAELEAMEL